MTGHAPLPRRLQLPPRFAFAQRYVQAFDRDLRLRKSAEALGFFVLERRKRRAPVHYVGLKDLTDQHIQARDGYDHVALVHPNWLTKPHNLVRALVDEGWDLWGERGEGKTGANAVADQAEEAEEWVIANRRRRRKQQFHAVALESYDILNRMGNPDGTDRTRITNVGLPAASSAAA